MKKFEVKNIDITLRTLVLCVLGAVLFVTIMGVTTVSVRSYKFNEQKIANTEGMEENELIKKKETAAGKEMNHSCWGSTIEDSPLPFPGDMLIYLQQVMKLVLLVVVAGEAGSSLRSAIPRMSSGLIQGRP